MKPPHKQEKDLPFDPTVAQCPPLLPEWVLQAAEEKRRLRAENCWQFKMLYDGACPFCIREVAWLQQRNRKGYLAFEDISSPAFDPSSLGKTREELLGVIHGVFPDGRLVSKVEVFRQAYRAVGLGWLIAPTEWPGLRWVFDSVYWLFARYRVRLGRLFGRSCAVETCGVQKR